MHKVSRDVTTDGTTGESSDRKLRFASIASLAKSFNMTSHSFWISLRWRYGIFAPDIDSIHHRHHHEQRRDHTDQ